MVNAIFHCSGTDSTISSDFRVQFPAMRYNTPDRLCMEVPVEFSVLGASTDHGTGQFYLSGESQSPKLALLGPIPPALSLPLPPTSPI